MNFFFLHLILNWPIQLYKTSETKIDQLDEEHTRLDAVWVKTRQTKTYKYMYVDLIYIYIERDISFYDKHTHTEDNCYIQQSLPILLWNGEGNHETLNTTRFLSHINFAVKLQSLVFM